MPNGSQLPSNMNHNFSRIQGPEIQRSLFNRTHTYKTTFDEGYLIPFCVDEILPGDTLNLQATMFARLATPIAPIMDNLHLDTFWFYIPSRILWSNWEAFQGEQLDPGDSTDFEIPVLGGEGGVGAFTPGSQSLGDYFGLPLVTLDGDDRPIALPFRAYSLIWNEWFRDQNLQDRATFDLGDGPDDGPAYVLLKRGKRHDYFTSALPWPQKGDAISIPLGTIAPVVGDGTALGFMGLNGGATTASYLLQIDDAGFNGMLGMASTDGAVGSAASRTGGAGDFRIGLSTNSANSGVYADLSAATAATVNQLREAFAFQQILERDARGGTRYTEILRAHFGVDVPDYRLQRPEYLGGSSTRIDVNGVAQTSSTDATTPQGNLAAYGQVVARSGFNKSFVEHGYIMGLVNVRADITYQQGMDRMWSRRTRFDLYMPALAHLGEQAIYNREIWTTTNNPTVNAGVFGYQERWGEYRHKPSKITGLFRSDAGGSVDFWHLSPDFSALPVLNAAFIEDDPPVERIVAVPSEPHFLFDSFISMKHARPMPMYSTPGLQRL